MASSSSGSSSESSSSSAPTRKRRRVEVEDSEGSKGDDIPHAASADEEDPNAPQPLPPMKDIVLSHAERRRQKKRQNLAAASPRKKRKLDDGTDPASAVPPPSIARADARSKAKAREKAASSTGDDPKPPKRQNSVWVGNLSFRTTQDALRRFFDGVGTITRIHMPMRHGKQVQDENMGFAYVDFGTPEAKVIAITLSEGHLDGRNLLIKDGDDFTGRPTKAKTEPSEVAGEAEGEKPVTSTATAGGKSLSNTARKILRAQKRPPAPTLFLGNLGFETTEGSIRELFEAHRYWSHGAKGRADVTKSDERDDGTDEGGAKSKDVWIRKIRMGTFEDSGVCKGFAFVDFTNIEHATEVLVNPRNHRLNGRDLVVEYASPDAVRRGGGGGTRNPKRDRDPKNKSVYPQKGSANANAPHTKQRPPQPIELEEGADVAETLVEERKAPRSERPGRVGHGRLHTRRAKPGATLARAQRQSAAILPSKGQKIVF